MKINGKMLIVIILIAAGATGVTLNTWTRGQVVGVFKQLSQVSSSGGATAPDKSWVDESAARSNSSWDRILTLDAAQIEKLGLKTETVKQQTEPTVLKLFGTTDYDPATVTVVRTQFDSRVEKVLVDLGTAVKIGDPLLELFSTDLAEAKSNYESAISQWERDKKVLDYKTPLAKQDNIPKKELIEVENDEAQSRLKMKLAKDKLLVYGLTEKEIENAKREDGVQKAKMILRSRADGVVVVRSVVKGNYYTSADLLMTIAPLDHLWVRGSVSELDADQVEVGQKLKIIFPSSNRTIDAEVGYIEKAIDAESRSAKFRTTIPNPLEQVKSGAFVRMLLYIQPTTGNTVISRIAMVSVDRYEYVFVKQPGKANRFERRQINVVKESNDFVIVAKPSLNNLGLTPGEEVVTTASLILEQNYEDRVMTEGSLLAEGQGSGSVNSLGGTMPVIAKTPH
jgi:cobalt-zinc-cadmium efflux system membrane fusion protein